MRSKTRRARLDIANLYGDEVGNAKLPKKFRNCKETPDASALGGSDERVARARGNRRWRRGIFLVLACDRRYPLARVEKSIAVLPFENLSEDKANAYFADGVQDEILTDLAKVADLKVISRTSVMQYKNLATRNLREIAQQLGVAHVLEGSVQRTGNRVRVSAQLIDARTDMHLWAEHYDRDLADVFGIQSEIAKTIADQLQAKISPSEKAAIEKAPTTDLAAFDLYERAKTLLADGTETSTRGRTCRKPPNYSMKLSPGTRSFCSPGACSRECMALCIGLGMTTSSLVSIWLNVAVQTALRLQPNAGETHRALATYYYYGFRDYARARQRTGRCA